MIAMPKASFHFDLPNYITILTENKVESVSTDVRCFLHVLIQERISTGFKERPSSCVSSTALPVDTWKVEIPYYYGLVLGRPNPIAQGLIVRSRGVGGPINDGQLNLFFGQRPRRGR